MGAMRDLLNNIRPVEHPFENPQNEGDNQNNDEEGDDAQDEEWDWKIPIASYVWLINNRGTTAMNTILKLNN